jgi:hypothetical protein
MHEKEDPAIADTRSGNRPGTVSTKVELWLLVIMMGLAVVGVGVIQVMQNGGRLYWIGLLLIYAVIGLGITWRRHAPESRQLWMLLRDQGLHWSGTFVAIEIVLFFESRDIASRGAAADDALLMLALSCFLAGVHINWIYLPISVVLAVMAVGLGYLDQISLYLVVIPLAALMIGIFARYLQRQRPRD